MTAEPGADGSYTIEVTWSNPPRIIDGPQSMKNSMPPLRDAWKQMIKYDTLKIKKVSVYEITKSETGDNSHILKETDKLTAKITKGEPNIFINIADDRGKADGQGDLPEGWGIGNNPVETINEKGETVTLNNKSGIGNSAKSGRIRYSLEPKQHDKVVWSMGPRSNKDDGIISHIDNVEKVLTQGHLNPWATGCLYSQPNGTFTSKYDAHRDTVADKSNYSDKADEVDKNTAEWAKFNEYRNTLNTTTVVSDVLVLQTSSGDQTLVYFDQSSEPQPSQTFYQGYLQATMDEMWWQNENSAGIRMNKPADKNSAATYKENGESLNIGGYNGKYSPITNKYKGNGDGKKFVTVFDRNTENIVVRPKRPTTGLLINSVPEKIDPEIHNDDYTTAETNQFWQKTVEYKYRQDPTEFYKHPDEETITFENGGTAKFSDKPMNKGFKMNAPYSDKHFKTNDIIIHTPVSAEYAAVIALDKKRDHRRKGENNATKELNELREQQRREKMGESADGRCPGTVDQCQYSALKCKYTGEREHTGACYKEITTVIPSIGNNRHDHTVTCINEGVPATGKKETVLKIMGSKTGTDQGGFVIQTAGYYLLELSSEKTGTATPKVNKKLVKLNKGDKVNFRLGQGTNKSSSIYYNNETDLIMGTSGDNELATYQDGVLKDIMTGSFAPRIGENATETRFTISLATIISGTGASVIDYLCANFPEDGQMAMQELLGEGLFNDIVAKANNNSTLTDEFRLLARDALGKIDDVKRIPSKVYNFEGNTTLVENPLFLCNNQPINAGGTPEGTKVEKILICNEPHHYNSHYSKTNDKTDICWEACKNDTNHAFEHRMNMIEGMNINASPNTQQDNNKKPVGDFINLDYGFQIYYPNKGNFLEGGQDYIGIPELTEIRGRGYINSMDTTEYTKHKRVKFSFPVIFIEDKGQDAQGNPLIEETLYHPDTWIDLVPVEKEVFNFYCPLAAGEFAGAHVQFDAEAINSKGYIDNEDAETNKERFQDDLTALHSATKDFFIDVVGRIGNLVVVDSGDLRYSNFFKKGIKGQWEVEGAIPKVDKALQNHYLGPTINIRGEVSSEKTHFTDTWGTQRWQDVFPADKAQKYWKDVEPTKLPLSGDKGELGTARKPELRLGYDLYLDVSTAGNYEDGVVKIIPTYYAISKPIEKLKTDPDSGKAVQGEKSRSIRAVDVYVLADGEYKKINMFNGMANDTMNPSVTPIPINLNWEKEHIRRQYTDKEKGISELVSKTYPAPPIVKKDAQGNWVSEPSNTGKVLPSGEKYLIGNTQHLLLGDKARTFIGDDFTYSAEPYEQFGGSNKNPGSVLKTHEYNLKGQRWHFKLGLPSSSIFVFAGDEPTSANIKKFKDNADKLLVTAQIVAIGQTYVLEHPPTDTVINVDGEDFNIPPTIPQVIGILDYTKSSRDDIDIHKTH